MHASLSFTGRVAAPAPTRRGDAQVRITAAHIFIYESRVGGFVFESSSDLSAKGQRGT
jgi:hypothetical protein